MTYLEPLQMNWLQLAIAFVASLVGTAVITLGSVPSQTSARRSQYQTFYHITVWIGAIAFSLSHMFVPLALNVPVAPHYYVIHILFTFAGCYAATYFGIWYARLPRNKTAHYIRTGFAIGATILIFDYLNTLFLFRGAIVFRPGLLLLTIIIVLFLCPALVRLLALSNRNRELNLYSKTTIPGILLVAAALMGFPMLTAFSVLPVEGTTVISYAFLLPHILTMLVSIGLLMIPDTYHDTRQNVQNQRIMETEQHYMSLFEYNPDCVLAFDDKGIITMQNRQAEHLAKTLGRPLVGFAFSDVVQGESREAAAAHYKQVLQGKSAELELQAPAADGALLTLSLTSLPIVIEGSLQGAYSIIKDITRSKKDQETIWHLAYEDELTGLSNRRSFQNFLSACTQPEDDEPAGAFTVFFIDLDRFKRVNDLFGHAFGDEVIKTAAAKLKSCLPPHGTIARMGGDEFTILIPELNEREDIEQLGSRLVDEFTQPFPVGHHTVKLSASVGIARYPEDGSDADLLIKRADAAMYDAKQNGSAQYQFYDAKRDQTSMEQITLENDLEDSIQKNQMQLYYQPKMDIRTGEMTGVEALLRWNHPELGMVPPDRFIPLAEKSGFIVPLEQWVLRTALEQIKQWEADGYSVVPVAVNISQIHLMKPTIFQSITSTIKELDFDTRLLELEITESAMMYNEEHVIQILNDLKRAGISVSMDDFGTGYSSLSYLHSLPIQCLKIDRSFIKKLTTDADSRAIAEMIISMARQLNLTIVAEGVETEDQVGLLKELQCFNAQGYFYSKPMPANDMIHQFTPPPPVAM
ncbi:putative bifunctional diguanylate cyclase/phosphodiesterase [Paenibacillus lemnae]|uniref:EAL domain-containing protein n=1 Tax=Paenibacillus lemnae TaxID=1330551 RepID=A0A848M0L2_PAELE|nr:EAL domain-containing protein [Paenibacillus lemnae]NMO94367.1 EAL domain-containing protein [Paenibacillus lemnae]